MQTAWFENISTVDLENATIGSGIRRLKVSESGNAEIEIA